MISMNSLREVSLEELEKDAVRQSVAITLSGAVDNPDGLKWTCDDITLQQRSLQRDFSGVGDEMGIQESSGIVQCVRKRECDNNIANSVNSLVRIKKHKGDESVDITTFGPNPRYYFFINDHDDASLVNEREVVVNLAATFTRRVVGHVHGLYTRIKVLIPEDLQDCLSFNAGMILAAMEGIMSKKTNAIFMGLEGVHKARYEVNLYIRCTTQSEKRKLFFKRGLTSFDDSGRPELCIRASMEEMHEKLQNVQDFYGLVGAVVHCVFFTSDKFDYQCEDSN